MPLCWGSGILPMYGTHGMWATSGPSCSAKESPVWSSLTSSRSAHSPIRAQPEGLVLCVLVSFLQAQKKGLFPHAQVLFVFLMQLFLWNWAFPLPQQRLWVISNLAQRFPAPSFLLKRSFCLQHGFSCCGHHIACSCLMPGRARRGILNPEGRGTSQPGLGMVVGNWDPSCADPSCGLRQDLPTILFSLFSLCSFWGIASQLTPAHNLLSIPLAPGGAACFCHALCEHCTSSSAVSGVQGHPSSPTRVIALCSLSLGQF